MKLVASLLVALIANAQIFPFPGRHRSGGGGPTINAGFEFRGTSGFVSTLPGDIFFGGTASCPGTNCFPVTSTIGGFSITYGWDAPAFESGWPTGCTGAATALDRNASVGDVRLAGIAGSAGDCAMFSVVLPAPGSYDLVFAIGDANSGQGPTTVQVFDGTSLLTSIVSSVTTGATQWYDASGTLRASQTAWTSTGATTVATVTTSGTKLGIKINGSSGSAFVSYFHITNH